MSPPPTATDAASATAADAARWFEEEVQPHDAQLKAYLRHSFPSVRDVEDLVQESYLRIWRPPLTSARGS